MNKTAPQKTDSTSLFNLDLYRLRLERAQNTLNDYDFLLKEAGENLADRLKDIKRDFSHVLEIGYRHPVIYNLLSDHCQSYTRASTIPNIDESECLYHPEFLPFKDNSFDLVICNLHGHHINDLPGLLIQAKRLLKNDGLLLMSLFGVETLTELRQSLAHVSANQYGVISPRISPLVDIRDAGGLLQRAGFNLPVTDKEIITVTYDNAFKLLVDLRGMGETNVLNQQSKNIPPKAFFPEVCTHYAHTYSNSQNKVKATFELIYLTAWKPDKNQQKPLSPGSAKTSLSEALKTTETKLS